jgi:tetratricopeptide (TPR) repeat protein
MVFRPEVFVSATPKELDAYRDVVKATLREIGAHPVEHTDLNISYGPLDGVLKQAIGQCDVVIHLTGFAFGVEPPDRNHGAVRRSVAHYEYDVGKSLNREVLSFVARPSTPVTPTPREDDDARMHQADHRRVIERNGEHWTFAGAEELAELIRSLRPRIMVRRRFIRMPFPARGKQLFGRERLLGGVQEAVERTKLVVLEPPAQFATSSASAGKTALAVEAAWRLYESGHYDFAFWVPAVSGADLESELVALTHADALALVKDEIAGHRVRLHAMRDWFRAEAHAGRFLLILDGVDHEVTWLAIEAMLPWLERGTVIITTRLPREIRGAEHLEVGAISTDACIALVASRLYGREPGEAEARVLEQLANVLGHQPFALQLAARTIADARQTPAQYLATLTGEADVSPTDRTPRVSRWLPMLAQVVLQSVARLEPVSRGILHMLVCLAPQPSGVPQAIFASRIDTSETRNALAHLEKVGLITFADEGQTILVHRLVREIVHDRLSPEEMARALDTARSLIEAALERTERSPGGAVVRTRLVGHCRVLLGQLNGHPLEAHAGRLARDVANWLRDTGRATAAEHFQRRALAIAERGCEPGHPDLIPELRLLAGILQDGRRFAEAAELRRRALAILEKQRGPRSSELVGELFGLASCLRAAGRLHEAEPVLRRALEIEEQISGRMHARTAIAAHTLGSLLEVLHRPEEAAPYYRRALEIDEQLQHCPPARLAARLHHVAAVVAACGQRNEAILMHERALNYDEQAFGPKHPELVAPLKQLASLFEQEGRHAEAAALLRRVLEIEDRAEGTSPIELASTLTSLAHTVAPGEAEALCRRALALLDDKSNWHPLARALRWECEKLLERGWRA